MIEILLQPGEYYVGNANDRMRTLLGSCVAIILWHRGQRIGAMSHFLLSSRGAVDGGELDARYAEEAVALMLRDLAAQQVSYRQCEAKIFGGAEMFPDATRAHPLNIGQRNGDAARSLMHGHGIPIVSESLFGVGHRQIIFSVASGHVWSRQVKPHNAVAPNAKDAP